MRLGRACKLDATYAMGYVSMMSIMREHPEARTEFNIAQLTRMGMLGSFTPQAIETFAEGQGLDLGLVKRYLEVWARRKSRSSPTQWERTYVRRMISLGRRIDAETSWILRRLSPVPIERSLAGQRLAFLRAVHSDWRGVLPEEEKQTLAVRVNQLAKGGVNLLNCRNAVISFPKLPLRKQYAFFVGVIRSGTLPLKAIVCASNRRFGRTWIFGVIRLAECPDRIPGHQPPDTIVRDRLEYADYEKYLEQWRGLAPWLFSDPDPAFRCDLSASNPHDTVFVPGRAEKKGWLVRLLWAVERDHYGECLF